MFHFEQLGRCFASDIAVPLRVCSTRPPGRSPDAVVEEDPGLLARDPARAPDPDRGAATGRLRLDIPGVACFDLDAAGRIRHARQALGEPDAPGLFLAETVVPLWCQLQGDVVLRATAVRDGDGASLLLGPSGCGKSVLACLLGERGFGLLGDGFCRLALDGQGQPLVFSSGLGLRLRAHSFDLLQIGQRRGPRLRPGVDRFEVLQAAPASGGPGWPLRRIWLLAPPRPSGAPATRPATALEAVTGLQANTYRAALAGSPAQQRRHFAAAAAAIHHAQVVKAGGSWGLGPLQDLADALAAGGPAPPCGRERP